MNKKLDLSVLAWFSILAVLLLVLFGIATWKDNHRDWMDTQRSYIEYQEGIHEKARLAAEAANKPAPAFPAPERLAIKQIMASELNRVDRCTSCHLGIDDPSMKDAPQPFRTHPNLDALMTQHAPERFGCTSCHHGQGMATTAEGAHGFIHKWDYPMLGDREHLTKYVQASCAQCHTDPTKWAAIGAPMLARGAQIVQEKNCASCHKFGDQGGAIGPELTFEGDKVPEQFGFEMLTKSIESGTFGDAAKQEVERGTFHHDVVAWHRYHFLNPAAVSSGSIMPAFGFSDEDLDAVITYILSRQHPVAPPSMTTNDANFKGVAVTQPVKKAEAPAAAPAAKPAGKVDGKAAYETNCAVCHQATGQGVPGTFPPIAGSEFANGSASEHITIVLKGKSGPITVAGKPYNGAMPPFPQLSDEDVAAIVTYERTSWGNHGGAVTADQVKALR